jgi:hypothetical protein
MISEEHGEITELHARRKNLDRRDRERERQRNRRKNTTALLNPHSIS